MQSLFELVPDNLFSTLASHNRRLYFRVLMVVRDCYQHELRFRRTDLARYLIHHLEDDLYRFRDDLDVDTTADEASATTTATAGSTISDDPDAPATLSARAFAIIRRLVETGWLRVIPDDQTFDELLIVPDYASALMDTFHAIVHPEERPYNAFVFGTYSALKTANEERGDYMFPGLQSAYDNIDALTKSLRALLDNIHRFYQSLQRQSEVRDLLAEHFDEYQTLVAARTYHPLKTVDSVHRFRPRILQILRGWLLDGEVLEILATSARIHRSGLEDVDAKSECIRMIQHIVDRFESMDALLRDIDRRNTNYSKASVERIQYLLNTDRDVKGKIVEILKRVPSLRDGTAVALVSELGKLPVYQVRAADPEGLYTEPRPRVRGKPQPLRIERDIPDALFREEADELVARTNAVFSHERVVAYILRQLSADGYLRSADMDVRRLEDFLRTMVAVIKADEVDVPYEIEYENDGQSVMVNGFRIPDILFKRTGVS